jgi:prevent-host-death family protein
VKLERDIVPITALKNRAADLVREVHDERRTLVVTQNGEPKAVLMDVHEYDRLQEALAVLKLAAQGEAELAAGRAVSLDDAFAAAARAIDAGD